MLRLAAFMMSMALIAAPASEPVRVDWARLRGLNYKTGRITGDVKAMYGQIVRIVGYVVPLEGDDVQRAYEFLVVPHNGSCIHTPAPPPNQIVHVKMDGGKPVKVYFGDPVTVQGRIRISTVKSPYGDVAYQMAGASVEKYADQ